jgi:hypothetical protein
MANHCYNFIEINGSEEEIKDFAKLLDLSDTQENGCEVYAKLLTEFCEGEIGENAKWFDLLTEEDTEDYGYLRISGDTAWSPSLDLFGKISEKYPSFKIRYEYEEMGNDFSGWADIENGEIQDNCFDYWEGQVAMNYTNALENAIANELECYDTETELIESDMYKAFSEDAQKEILENYNK